MNKQELIDEAIRDNDGVWPHAKGLVLNVAGPCNVSYTPFLSLDFSATEVEHDKYWTTLCTKSEFQQRAKELGYGGCGVSGVKESLTDDWFDYESQKAIKLPPVGEKVSVFLHWSGIWSGWVVIVGHDGEGVVWRSGVDKQSYIYSPINEIRPLDLESRQALHQRQKVIKAAMEFWMSADSGTAETFGKLYDAGFLKLPEQKDEK